MTAFQILVVPALFATAFWVLIRAVRGQSPRRMGVFWSMLWATAGGLVAAPGATAIAAHWLGIGRGADLVFYATTSSGLGASLSFYGRCRRLEEMLTILARREALRGARRGGPGTPGLDRRSLATPRRTHPRRPQWPRDSSHR